MIVRLTPRASRDQIVGPHGDALAVKVTAPPVDGRANLALRRLIAKAIGIPLRRVELARGAKGRAKVLLLRGLAAAEAAKRLT